MVVPLLSVSVSYNEQTDNSMTNKKACKHQVYKPKQGASEHTFPSPVARRMAAPLILAAFELLRNHRVQRRQSRSGKDSF